MSKTLTSNMTRSGSTPKMITFSMSNTPRRFEYQQKNSTMTNVELRGNLSKRAAEPEYHEFNQFRRMNLHEVPNTKRTMVPELAPEAKVIQRNNSSKNFGGGNFASLMAKTGRDTSITNCRRAPNPKVYSSFNVGDIGNETVTPYRRETKTAEFKKYDSTTQIVFLPGGVKRSQNDINDDKKPIIPKTNQSFSSKVVRDFNSNISCLPGNMINTEPIQKQRLVSARRYESNDIFNRQPTAPGNGVSSGSSSYVNQNNFNSFKVSNAKNSSNAVNRSVFDESKNEKKLIEYSRIKRPEYIKNPFASQITIK